MRKHIAVFNALFATQPSPFAPGADAWLADPTHTGCGASTKVSWRLRPCRQSIFSFAGRWS